jgi:ribonuclease P protein component
MPSHKFISSERLKSRKTIAALFQKDKSKSFGAYPLRLVWTPLAATQSEQPPIQAAFAVPKKNFRRANVRNTIKRRIRESYRLHKHLLYDALAPHQDNSSCFALMWLYTGKELLSYSEIDKAMQNAIKRFIKELR